MILADTSVVLEIIRSRDAKLVALAGPLPIATCGPVRAEILTGARGPADRARLLGYLNSYQRLTLDEPHWDLISDYRSAMEQQGYCLSLADAAIGSLALIYNIELWSRDCAHRLMAQIFPALRLFVEPP